MTLHFDPDSGTIFVPTRLTGPSEQFVIQMALDTGASISMVNAAILIELGYVVTDDLDRVPLVTASGIEDAPRLMVQSLEAMGIVRRDFPLVCHTLPSGADVDGLLGLDFFRDLRLTIDFRENTVTVE